MGSLGSLFRRDDRYQDRRLILVSRELTDRLFTMLGASAHGARLAASRRPERHRAHGVEETADNPNLVGVERRAGTAFEGALQPRNDRVEDFAI